MTECEGNHTVISVHHTPDVSVGLVINLQYIPREAIHLEYSNSIDTILPIVMSI